MHPAVLLGVPAAAVAGAFTLGILLRRLGERRATIAESLALAARRGIPLHVPLSCAAELASPRRGPALRAVAEDLRAGRPVHESLRAHLRWQFPAAVDAALAAGERASRLPEALEAVAAEAGRDLGRRQRVALAAFYPVLLFLSVGLLNLLVLEGRLKYVVWDESASGAGAGSVWPVVAVRYVLWAVAAAWIGAVVARRIRRPVTGVASSRFLRTTALLLSAGRPVHTAFAEAAASAGAPRLARAVEAASARLQAGEPLAEQWRTLPIARAARDRLAAAVTTGLPVLLEEVAQGCDARDARAAERWIRWSVPVATAVAGLLVAVDYAMLTSAWVHVQEAVRPW